MPTSNTAETLYRDGQRAAGSGRLQEALAAISKALEVNPGFADAHYELGNVLRRLDRPQDAERYLRDAIRLNPQLAEAYFSLAFLLRDQGRIREIENVLSTLSDALPGDAERIEEAAGLLADYGCLPLALTLFQRAACLRTDLPRLDLRIGQMQQKLGRFDAANEAFMGALRKDPQMGPAYLLLAHNGRAANSADQRLALCESALNLPSLSENTRICLHFSLGKLLDDAGDYNRAFEQFSAGNKLRRAQTGFDRPVWQRYFLALQQILPGSPAGNQNRKLPIPVFIIGMPRSGTTLIHRLLSNHPDVSGLGETEMVDQLVETLASHTATDYPACLTSLRAADFEALAREYRSRWPREASSARYVLDKNPLNFLHVGLIARLFPDARFIHCQRDPRDIAISVYFQNFAHPRNSYAYDLTDIGHFYSGYHNLMVHWQSVLAPRIYALRYERVVTHPEAEMRQLLAALGLDWNDACMKPESGAQEISTASVWQARQPLYSDSIGRWRHYENELKPFIDILPPTLLQS
ncbi:MAG TPA: sulfotransferase [Gammaproteobacteria bacterium]